MDAAIDHYLEYIRKHRSLRTYRTYRPVLNVLFRNSYTKTYVDEVTREDILKFTSDCFDQGLVPRTVYDRLVTVLQLFKRHGYKGLVEASDWPSYVETIRPDLRTGRDRGDAPARHSGRGDPHQVLSLPPVSATVRSAT